MSRRIENRLASTLTAMAEQITDSTVSPARPLDVDQGVDEVRFSEPTVVNMRRRNRWLAPMLAAASVAALVVGGVALTRRHHDKSPTPAASHTSSSLPTLSSTPASSPAPSVTAKTILSLGQQGTAKDVPWDRIGPGWTLDVVTASVNDTTGVLYLVDPLGGRYVIAQHSPTPAAWSPDGQRALFVSYDDKRHDFAITERDLRTFAELHATTVAGDTAITVTYTRPTGTAMVVAASGDNGGTTYAKYGTDGVRQAVYPSATSALGKFSGSPVYTPDGLHFFLGAEHGLAYLDNGGALAGEFPAPVDGYCIAGHMLDATTVTVSCGNDVYTLNVGTGTFTRVTRFNPQAHDGLGYVEEYLTRGGTFLLTAQGCGGMTLSTLNADGTGSPVHVSVPAGVEGHLHPVAVGSDAIFFASSGCQGVGSSLVRYDLNSGRYTSVVGPGATSGVLNATVSFSYGRGSMF